MNQNYILVESSQQQLLETVLMDLSNLYRDVPYSQGIQLFRRKQQSGIFLILFRNEPDFDRFSYFTNYLVYPMEHMNFKPKVRGYFRTEEVTNYPKLRNYGEWLMVYINENDDEGDNVYLTTEDNKGFIYDFGGNLKSLEQAVHEFKKQDIQLSGFHHIIDIYPAPAEVKANARPWWKFW